MKNNIVRFMNFDCHVELNRFQHDNSICFSLVGANTEHNEKQDVFPGEPISRLSVCIDGVSVSKTQSLIKVEEYNNPMEAIEMLVKAGFISEPIKFVDMGFVKNGAALVDVLVPTPEYE